MRNHSFDEWKIVELRAKVVRPIVGCAAAAYLRSKTGASPRRGHLIEHQPEQQLNISGEGRQAAMNREVNNRIRSSYIGPRLTCAGILILLTSPALAQTPTPTAAN